MQVSEEIWQTFISKPGAFVGDVVGISSEQAIGGVITTICKYNPLKILELGAGIGTLTYTVLKTVTSLNNHRNNEYAFFTVENNEFCLNQLTINLFGFDGMYTVIPSTEALPIGILFDFIIVDGGGDLDGDMGIIPFGNMLAQNGIILVEGGRAFQRDCIKEWYGARQYVYVKMPAWKQTIVANSSGKTASNKPYHLFVFEPAWFNKLTLKIRSFILNRILRIRRRLAIIKNRLIAT